MNASQAKSMEMALLQTFIKILLKGVLNKVNYVYNYFSYVILCVGVQLNKYTLKRRKSIFRKRHVLFEPLYCTRNHRWNQTNKIGQT